MGKQAKHNFIEKEKEKRKQVYHSHAYLKKKWNIPKFLAINDFDGELNDLIHFFHGNVKVPQRICQSVFYSIRNSDWLKIKLFVFCVATLSHWFFDTLLTRTSCMCDRDPYTSREQRLKHVAFNDVQ